MTKKRQEIYFDNSGTTQVIEPVADFAYQLMREEFGNPSAAYARGLKAEKLLAEARRRVGETLDVNPAEIFFTSGGTESDNLALRGVMQANRRRGKHLIVSAVELSVSLATSTRVPAGISRIRWAWALVMVGVR